MRRSLREMVKSLFDVVKVGLDIQKKLDKAEPETNEHDEYLYQ